MKAVQRACGSTSGPARDRRASFGPCGWAPRACPTMRLGPAGTGKGAGGAPAPGELQAPGNHGPGCPAASRRRRNRRCSCATPQPPRHPGPPRTRALPQVQTSLWLSHAGLGASGHSRPTNEAPRRPGVCPDSPCSHVLRHVGVGLDGGTACTPALATATSRCCLAVTGREPPQTAALFVSIPSTLHPPPLQEAQGR